MHGPLADSAVVVRISPLVLRDLLRPPPPPPPPVKPTYSVIRFRHFNFTPPPHCSAASLFRVFRILRTSTAAPAAAEGPIGVRAKKRSSIVATFQLLLAIPRESRAEKTASQLENTRNNLFPLG